MLDVITCTKRTITFFFDNGHILNIRNNVQRRGSENPRTLSSEHLAHYNLEYDTDKHRSHKQHLIHQQHALLWPEQQGDALPSFEIVTVFFSQNRYFEKKIECLNQAITLDTYRITSYNSGPIVLTFRIGVMIIRIVSAIIFHSYK